MEHSGFSIELKLAYAPLCNFDFTYIKREPIIQEILKGSMLYVIGQRPMITFDDITFNRINGSLNFDITLKGTVEKLKCSLPVYQELIEPNDTKAVNILFGSYDKTWNFENLPVSQVNGIQIFDKDMKFILWLSPDKLLHLFWNKIIKANIIGDLRPFTTYLVHYVGKATDQEIWQRLTGHKTLQEILSIENPFNYGTLPTHEIILLLFRVSDLISIRTMGNNVDDFVKQMFGHNLPNDKDVSLDAEKLLIKLLDPNYNNKKFPNYPKSTDGLYKFSFDSFMYHIAEEITLKYSERELHFSCNQMHSDLIKIKGNKDVEVIKHK